jgi:superfamily II DNA or RNA helicase
MPERSMIKSGLWDNQYRGKVGEYLRRVFLPDSAVSIVSAYFTIYAYEALREELEGIDSLRFLYGDPDGISSVDPSKPTAKAFGILDDEIRLENRLSQKRIARDCADWIKRKVEIRSVRQAGLLHGKMYHVSTGGEPSAIVGSSNFTVHGLGLAADGNNIELNLEVNDRRDRNDLLDWFEALWTDETLTDDVKERVLDCLAQVYGNYPPEFIYYKTLYHIFQKYLGERQDRDAQLDRTTLLDSRVWKTLYAFQKDGVKGAINKILNHNGCVLADSVGLGKTYEALAVIKYFELRNDRVLVLCPKKLKSNWTVYKYPTRLNPFVDDRFRFDVLAHTDLSRDQGDADGIDLAALNWGAYDLVVIDESHNFRNNTRGRKDEEGHRIHKSRYEHLMEDVIQSGVRTKVLLLSATPVNTDLKDLRNQIYFLTEGRDDAFAETIGIRSVRDTLTTAQQQFHRWARKPSERRESRDLLAQLNSAFFKLLDELTIARSRRHIERYYADSIKELGGFPERLKPVALYPDIDRRKNFLSYDRLNDEISQYQLSLFTPFRYVKKDYQALYQGQLEFGFSQATREYFLTGMMKVNFLKRLESSVHSFAITLDRTIEKIRTLEARLKKYKAVQKSGEALDAGEMKLDFAEDQEAEDAFEVGTLEYKFEHLHIDKWLKDLEQDRQQLHLLLSAAKSVTPDDDEKLHQLRQWIQTKVEHPTTNRRGERNRKVLVFTAFADTADYLYENLKDWVRDDLGVHIAIVSGGTKENRATLGAADYNQILTNFSPRSKRRDQMANMPQDEEIDVLIATDCISEGQNLQDCDTLINYDIHWNPVRIIQRFGRIDRIGSVNEAVQLVNFWPTHDLNRYINLKNRVESRMALVDISATFEDNVLKADELEDLVSEDLRYRDKQLLRLKDEILDLEDISESITLSEFTLDDFRIDLDSYLKANERELRDAPLGLYAVVPPHPDYAAIRPGTIFCLRHRVEGKETDKVNPLHPCYLTYILEDGHVRFGFTHAKQILEIYRSLCAGKTSAYEELCALFDRDTGHGVDTGAYSELLRKTVRSIATTFRRRAASGLQSGRGFVLPDRKEQVTDIADFELIAWLVVKEVEEA